MKGAMRNRMIGAGFLFLMGFAQAYAQTDPLPSWNDGLAKKAIVEFVKTTTDNASPKFVPPEARIATFDQDGTLWLEHPMYRRTQLEEIQNEAHQAQHEGRLCVVWAHRCVRAGRGAGCGCREEHGSKETHARLFVCRIR